MTGARPEYHRLLARTEGLLAAPTAPPDTGELLGRSREGREVRGVRIGSGRLRVSLLAGCHADEPVGPALLRRLASYLGALPGRDPLLHDVEWWIVPHVNPDGERANRAWQRPPPPLDAGYDPCDYLAEVRREEPGDDLEFGFPRGSDDGGARPETRAVREWWGEAGGPFDLHVSLHGMAFAAGPWFLVEPAWRSRPEIDRLLRRCTARTGALGYVLHDVEREGEKGFHRIRRGFATRPSSDAMASHFLERGEPDTAGLFRPSSMEAVRALGGDPLTLVSEVPLFLTPGVGEELGPPDPAAETWRERRERWTAGLRGGERERRSRTAREMRASGLQPVPIGDQMRLQWALVAAGVEAVAAARA